MDKPRLAGEGTLDLMELENRGNSKYEKQTLYKLQESEVQLWDGQLELRTGLLVPNWKVGSEATAQTLVIQAMKWI